MSKGTTTTTPGALGRSSPAVDKPLSLDSNWLSSSWTRMIVFDQLVDEAKTLSSPQAPMARSTNLPCSHLCGKHQHHDQGVRCPISVERHFIILISDSRHVLVLVIELNEDDVLHFVIDFYLGTNSSSTWQRWLTV